MKRKPPAYLLMYIRTHVTWLGYGLYNLDDRELSRLLHATAAYRAYELL